MLRLRFELLPGGDESRARTIGLMEISNVKMNGDGTADYAVVLTKTPPFKGALRSAWKKGLLKAADGAVADVMASEDDDVIAAKVAGHHRTRRGVYDLCLRALLACGLGSRIPRQSQDPSQ